MVDYVASKSDIPSAFRLDKRQSDLSTALLQKIERDDDVVIDPEVYVPEHKKTDEQLLDDDFKLVRENLKGLLEINIERVKEYSELVSGTDSPRAYEVFSKMVESTVELNKNLMTLHQERNKSREGPSGITNIQNQQINMISPMEAIRLLREGKQQDEQ